MHQTGAVINVASKRRRLGIISVRAHALSLRMKYLVSVASIGLKSIRVVIISLFLGLFVRYAECDVAVENAKHRLFQGTAGLAGPRLADVPG